MLTKSTLKHFILLVAVILTCQISYSQKDTLKILNEYSVALRKQKLFANYIVLDSIKVLLDGSVLADYEKPDFIKKTNTGEQYKNLNLEDFLYYDSSLGIKKINDKIIVPLTMYRGMHWAGIEDFEIRNGIINTTLENLHSFYSDSSLAIKNYITLFAEKFNLPETKIVFDIQSSPNVSHACMFKMNNKVHIENPKKNDVLKGCGNQFEVFADPFYKKMNVILLGIESNYDPPFIHECRTLSNSFNIKVSEIDKAFYSFIDDFFKRHPGYIKNVTKIEAGTASVTIYKLKDCITNSKNTYERLEIILTPRYFDGNTLQFLCRCSAKSIISTNTTFAESLFEDRIANDLNNNSYNKKIDALKKIIAERFENYLKTHYDTK
jgi:hypothetical protein